MDAAWRLSNASGEGAAALEATSLEAEEPTPVETGKSGPGEPAAPAMPAKATKECESGVPAAQAMQEEGEPGLPVPPPSVIHCNREECTRDESTWSRHPAWMAFTPCARTIWSWKPFLERTSQDSGDSGIRGQETRSHNTDFQNSQGYRLFQSTALVLWSNTRHCSQGHWHKTPFEFEPLCIAILTRSASYACNHGSSSTATKGKRSPCQGYRHASIPTHQVCQQRMNMQSLHVWRQDTCRIAEAKKPGPTICSVNPGGWSRVTGTLTLPKLDIVAVQETFLLRDAVGTYTASQHGYYSSFTPARKAGGRPSGGLALLCKQAQPLQRME
eukprot:1788686-Amphidinium_carterae.2